MLGLAQPAPVDEDDCAAGVVCVEAGVPLKSSGVSWGAWETKMEPAPSKLWNTHSAALIINN